MKKGLNLLVITIITGSISCGHSESNAQTENTASMTNENQQTGIEGEWQKTGMAFDDNKNGTLDDNEIKKDKGLSGYDYFHFYANGKCIFDKDVKFEGTYVIKPDKYKKRAIFIYGSGMPAGLSRKEKDGAAYVYRIQSVDGTRLVLAPAHLHGKLVLYTRK